MIIVDAKLSILHLVFQFQLLTLRADLLFLESKNSQKKTRRGGCRLKAYYMRYSVDFFACVYSLT